MASKTPAPAAAYLRGFARRVRWLPERLLHPLRRRRALARLSAAARPESILIVCLGNICRSPYAHAVLDRDTDPHAVSIASAGFIRPGRSSPPEAITVAAERGFDLSAHRSYVLDGTEGPYDLVVFMDPRHVSRARAAGVSWDLSICLGDLDPDPVDRRRIFDPYGGDEDVFRRSFDRIDRCLASLRRASGLGPPS